MVYFVYLLRSTKDGEFYIGQTDDVQGRLAYHNSGLVHSTAHRRPFSLAGYVELVSRGKAMRLERALKLHSDQKLKFIRKFIPGFDWKNRKDMPR